jgi:hypothetical protein
MIRGALLIKLHDEEKSGQLYFYDTRKGSYRYAESDYVNGDHILKISGLKAGTESYFYFCLPDFSHIDTSKLYLIVSEN